MAGPAGRPARGSDGGEQRGAPGYGGVRDLRRSGGFWPCSPSRSTSSGLFSVSRAASRYAERLVSHDVTFRLLAELRTRFYARLAPLAPARLLQYRSGDLSPAS